MKKETHSICFAGSFQNNFLIHFWSEMNLVTSNTIVYWKGRISGQF